jgi:basic amino acid/polyamine antiporter, APA family
MSSPRPRIGAGIDAAVARAKLDRERLDGTALGPVSLTALGIAMVVGAGIFVTTGQAAADFAGPAVVISFVLAGIAAGAAALCYAEFASMIPAAGSTYSYAYAAFGLFPAWFIGWDLMLEYLFAASTVAVGWSGYAVDLLDSVGIGFPSSLATSPFDGGTVNLPAVFIVVATIALLAAGTRESARANNAMVALKVAVLLIFIGVGAFYVSSDNWTPFVPASEGSFGEFGASGILRGAGIVFFAYIGFDGVATAAAETRDPRRTVPLGLLATVVISAVLYVAVALVMTGMTSYTNLGVADPISAAIEDSGSSLDWLKALVNVSAVIGLAATVLTAFYGQSRIFMRMSSDGMLPDALGRVSPRTQTPRAALAVCAVAGGLVAGLVPIDDLVNLISIGTLLAFLMVSLGVLALRRARPDLERPFRVPAVRLTATIAIVSSLALMVTLPIETWIRLAVWLLVGLVIFFGYGRARAVARRAELEGAA